MILLRHPHATVTKDGVAIICFRYVLVSQNGFFIMSFTLSRHAKLRLCRKIPQKAYFSEFRLTNTLQYTTSVFHKSTWVSRIETIAFPLVETSRALAFLFGIRSSLAFAV